MFPADQNDFIQRLAKLSCCWQFITLAGLHTTALATNVFAKEYSTIRISAYTELV